MIIKAILMDFNGVIIDDEPVHMKAYQEILKTEGIDLTEEEYYSCLGMNDKAFIEAAYKRAGKEPAANKVLEITIAKSNRWREIVADDLPIFPGVVDFIRKMEKDFALGIVSMARREEIEYVLERANIADCFSVIVSAEDISTYKPDPQCYFEGFNLIDAIRMKRGSNPMVHSDCLVIEDTPPGILAGKRAGLKTLGVTNTVDAKALREAGADSVTKNLDDWMPGSIRGVFA
ncbi:MAG: HAD-superfamily hydrolase, subfamily variant 3 [Acidobacteria bacterium]|nr:HAD-superfamily hydrolase, subfamily variant 3 [Acidobacteriota bacterium]